MYKFSPENNIIPNQTWYTLTFLLTKTQAISLARVAGYPYLFGWQNHKNADISIFADIIDLFGVIETMIPYYRRYFTRMHRWHICHDHGAYLLNMYTDAPGICFREYMKTAHTQTLARRTSIAYQLVTIFKVLLSYGYCAPMNSKTLCIQNGYIRLCCCVGMCIAPDNDTLTYSAVNILRILRGDIDSVVFNQSHTDSVCAKYLVAEYADITCEYNGFIMAAVNKHLFCEMCGIAYYANLIQNTLFIEKTNEIFAILLLHRQQTGAQPTSLSLCHPGSARPDTECVLVGKLEYIAPIEPRTPVGDI